MKVLWITNIKLPSLNLFLGENKSSIGGWMSSLLLSIKERKDIEIAVATFDKRNDLLDIVVEGVRYFLIPTYGHHPHKYNKRLESEWKRINELYQPDIVHIHGTEFPHGLAWVKANGGKNVCVSIQGLVSVYSRYYNTGSKLDYLPLTFRDLIRIDWISKQRKNFAKRGNYEIELLKSVNNIIGRTDWDRVHSWSINPEANYHYCGETLRELFYNRRWIYENCRPYSIFVSQGHYPVKGLHKMLEALPLILSFFPTAHLYVGGENILGKPWYRKTSYAVLLKRIMKKYSISDHVSFVGMLNEEKMCEQYLNSNVFVLPSSIENSPNSIGEAQVLGMPFVASYVGGVPEIVQNNPDHLYRYNEIEMLAEKICKIFEKGEKIKNPIIDISRYDKDLNTNTLINIYKRIINNVCVNIII